MKTEKMAKRGIALLLTLAMIISCLPMTVFAASEEYDLSPEALRVSDEFAAQYPNGLLDIVNQNTITNEDSGEIHFYVARRGGTDGEFDVSLKAIEMTAKYGEDFVFLEEGLFSSNEVEKVIDSPTLLESSIIDYGDEPVTVEGAESYYEEETEAPSSDEAQAEDEVDNTAVEDNKTDTATESETDRETESVETYETEITAAEVSVESDGYASSLHKMRDEILNKKTTSNTTYNGYTDLANLFSVENEDDVLRDEAMSAVMPGAVLDLHFDDGENYKIITVKILNDDIVEDDEAFMLGLFNCEGAELGNSATSNVCITDNDIKTELTDLYFEESYVSAYDQSSTVRLKIARSNNIETYQLLQIQTMGDTAVADKNYSSLITETVLLAGQEYKYIDIPIKKANITESVSFDVVVSGAECNDTTATVVIYPTDTDAGIALMSDDISLMATDSQPYITIQGGAYNGNNQSYANSGSVYVQTKGDGEHDFGVVELSKDSHRWGYLKYNLDLRGIEKVVVAAHGAKATTRYPDRVQHNIYIEDGTKNIYKEKNWNGENFTFTSSDFAHKKTRLIAKAESWVSNDTALYIHWITLYKQKITLQFDAPDTFKIPIYSDAGTVVGYYTDSNGKEVVVAPQASISALNKDSSRPNAYYRDDTVTLNSTLSSAGNTYGAYLKGYELYNPATGAYTYFDGTSLTLTPDIIGTYVYGNGSTYKSILKIKPVYGRKSVESKITAGNYATHKGSMSFANEILKPNIVKDYIKLTGYTNVEEWDDFHYIKTYPWVSVERYDEFEEIYKDFSGCFLEVKGEKTYENPKWCVGDYIALTLTPAEGYTATGVNDVNGNKISSGTSNTMYVQLKESGNYIMPVFGRNDCGVTFLFEGNTDGLYVFHDKKDNADSTFLTSLYKNTTGLSNWNGELFTGILNNKIKNNYDILRKENLISGQKLSNLAIGEVVTVFAEAPDGYIPYWYIDDGQKNITTQNDKIYVKHYGNSFSFEMTSNDVTLYCGMERKTAENYVMTGKLVKPSQTLKTGGYAQVNPSIPASYMTVSGASMSSLNFDERYNSVTIDGVTYYTSVTTDKDGNFTMYVPNVSEREYFSVKYLNGEQAKSTTLLAADGKTYYIVVPANDVNYTVKDIQCLTILGDSAEINGLINIPHDSANANRIFTVNTVTANENYTVGEVVLKSYRKDGSLIKGISMTESSSIGLESYWKANVNVAEVLAEGGRITVEVFDKNGKSHGEVETGYSMEKELQPTNIKVDGMPEEYASMGLSNVPIVGSSVPTVPGTSFTEQPDDKTMEIAVGQGETLKNAIYSQLEEFDNSDNWSKLMYLTNYITDTYNVNVNNKKEATKSDDGSKYSDSKFPILFDFGMYMKLDKNDDGTLSLNYVFVTVGLSAGATKNMHWVLCGIPLYVTLSANVTGRGLIGLNGTTDYFSEQNVHNDEFYALLGKYGQDEIENNNYSTNDETEQKLFEALYNQSNLTTDQSQNKDTELKDFDEDKKEATAEAIDKLLDRYDFYYLNESLFEAKQEDFSYALQSRIAMYKQLVTLLQRIEEDDTDDSEEVNDSDKADESNKTEESDKAEGSDKTEEKTEREPFKSNVMIEYDDDVKQAWIHRLNLMLLLECLPDYLDEGKATYDISAENYFGLANLDENLAVTGIVSLKPSFAVGLGVGKRGTFSVGVSGHIDFVVNWQPWTETRGTVTFAVNADVDLWVIPLSVRLVGYTAEMFRTDGYLDNAFDIEEGGSGVLMSLMSSADNELYSSVNTSPSRRRGSDKLEPVEKISLFASYDDGLSYVDATMDYQTETTKHPQPNLYLLPNGNKLIIYMNDNLDRDLYDRNSVYYSVFDKDTETWSNAVEIDNDGTLDGDIATLKLSDGRVAVAWTDSDCTFGNDLPELADLATSQNISLCIFDENGNPSEVFEITSLEDYGYSEPSLSSNGETLTIVYKITDYRTDGVEFDYDDFENTYQSFVSDSYETLALTEFDVENKQIINDGSSEYALYEETDNIDLNGMRFIDSDITGLENPKLYDITAAVYDGKTYITYSMDTDNNTSTSDDRELFCIIRENGENSKPIRLTDNNVDDGNANIVVSDLMNTIYFGSDDKICTIDLEELNSDALEDMGSYYVMNGAEEQTDSVLEYGSTEAADGFKIIIGENGMLYMLWSEFSTTTVDDKVHKSRALYMKAYDPMFTVSEYEDEEYGTQTVYTGSWGLTNEILNETDYYLNETAMVVSADDEYSLAYRMFAMDEYEDNGVSYEKEQDTSTLCVSDFVLVSTISAEKTSQYPLYPKEGELVSLDFNCLNYGAIPSDMIQFNYYIQTDADIEGLDEHNNCWWEKGDGVNSDSDKSFAVIKSGVLFEGHVASGANLGDTIQFIMPSYEKEVSIYVMAWEDEIEEPTISKMSVAVAPNIEAYDLNASLSQDEQELTISGIVRNTGNYPAENVVLKIYADGTYDAADILFDNENTDFDEDSVNQVVCEIEIDSLAVDEEYDLNYTFISTDEESSVTRSTIVKKSKLSGKYFTSDGTAGFSVVAEYDDATQNDDVVLYSTIEKKSKILGSTYVQKDTDSIPTLTNMNVEMPSLAEEISLMSAGADLTIAEGETKDINITLEPYGSTKGYSLIYESADNSIAQINSSSGQISGISEGETTITIKAVKNDSSNIVIVDEKGDFYLDDGSIWDYENDASMSGNNVVMTKEIKVEVSGLSEETTSNSHSGGTTRYMVKFETNGGTEIASKTVVRNAKLTEPTAPKRDGYTFNGWYTDEELTEKYDFDSEVTKNFILYAKWEKHDEETTATSEWENPFEDVKDDDWFFEYVKYANLNELMKGVSENLFAPQSELTRAMFVTVLYRMENEPSIEDEILGYPFADVDSDSWYTDAVYWARKEGIVKGVDEETFAPNDNITREQMAAIMFRYAKYKNIAPIDNWAIKLDYNDLEEISDYATEAVMYCKLKGIMQGKDNNMFAPKDNATRAETAAILQRFLQCTYVSNLGYSIVYNPTVFALNNDGDYDTFIYNGSTQADLPIYITVQPYSDMDAKTIIDGLVLQSGIDGVEATEGYFGADNIEAQHIYIEKDIDGTKQIQVFYVISVDKGSMILEIGGYVGADKKIDAKIEEMLATFSLKVAE